MSSNGIEFTTSDRQAGWLGGLINKSDRKVVGIDRQRVTRGRNFCYPVRHCSCF